MGNQGIRGPRDAIQAAFQKGLITLVGEGLDFNILNRLAVAFDELNLPWKFDVSIFSEIENQDLVAHITRVGKTFYQK